MEKLDNDEILIIKIMLLDRIKTLDEEIEKIQYFISPRILKDKERDYYLDLCGELDKTMRGYRNIYNKLNGEKV